MLLTLAGPSETHVVTATTLGPRPEDWAPLPSIGLPIDDTACYVLVHGEPAERQSLALVAMGGACMPAAATPAPLAAGREGVSCTPTDACARGFAAPRPRAGGSLFVFKSLRTLFQA